MYSKIGLKVAMENGYFQDIPPSLACIQYWYHLLSPFTSCFAERVAIEDHWRSSPPNSNSGPPIIFEIVVLGRSPGLSLNRPINTRLYNKNQLFSYEKNEYLNDYISRF